MTPRMQYNVALEVAVRYGMSADLTMQDLCEGLVNELASLIGPKFQTRPELDLDSFLEIVRHQLDIKTAAYATNGGATQAQLPAVTKRQPPKESA